VFLVKARRMTGRRYIVSIASKTGGASGGRVLRL
jgi:hypothetical protein